MSPATAAGTVRPVGTAGPQDPGAHEGSTRPGAARPQGSVPDGGPQGDGPDILMRARGLEVRFGQTQALRGIDLDVITSEVLAVTGPSGSGKSTLLHVMAGVLVPDAGSVRYAAGSTGARSSTDRASRTSRADRGYRGYGRTGRTASPAAAVGDTPRSAPVDVTTLGEAARSRLRLREFGFIFQFGQLLPDLSALDNVTLPLLLAGTSRKKALETSRDTLDELGLLEHVDKLPGQMSGGQAQRVAVARSLVTSPRLIFADEPTGSLDSLAAERTMEALLRSVRARGATMVVITHDPRTAAYADRAVTVRDGRVSAGTVPSSAAPSEVL